MIELVQHIETLLLDNDCVIIPDFGGFVAHHSSAKWVEEEGLYLPPTRTIGFNPHLKINDGLLVQSYMQTYHTDFSDASKRLEEAVTELNNILHKDGKAELHGIGTLSLNIDNTYEFCPNEDGVVAPELYGLSSFGIEKLKSVMYRQEEKRIVPDEKSSKNVYEIRINRTLLRHAVAAAVAIIAFFFMSTPVENTYIETDNYAELISLNIFNTQNNPTVPVKQALTVQSSDKKKVTDLKPKAIRVEKVTKNNNNIITAETSQVTPSIKEGKYNIIIASVNNRSEAETVIQKCIKEGYTNAKILEGNGRTRISLMSFSDRNEANKKLNELRQSPTLKDAWLLSK